MTLQVPARPRVDRRPGAGKDRGLMSDAADRDRRVRAVFEEALRQDESTREAYVHRACADDPELQTEVV